MPISYNTLKRITGDGILNQSIEAANIADGSVTNSKFVDSAITATKIASTAITSGKIAESAVSLSSNKLVNTLPISKGGTNRTTVGSAFSDLRVNNAGNAFEYGASGLVSCQVWTGNGTWTKPAGVTRVRVQVVGAGGGGSGHGEAGGAGGYSERILNVEGISSVGITVGGGGGGTWYHNVGGGGGTSSFGPYASAGGGEGARNVGGHSGGRPGRGSGGDVNIYGGGGSGHTNKGSGSGGASFFGSSAIGTHNNSPHTYDYEGYATPGSGGTGASEGHGRGANAVGGMVVVWEYR